MLSTEKQQRHTLKFFKYFFFTFQLNDSFLILHHEQINSFINTLTTCPSTNFYSLQKKKATEIRSRSAPMLRLIKILPVFFCVNFVICTFTGLDILYARSNLARPSAINRSQSSTSILVVQRFQHRISHLVCNIGIR